MEYIGFLLKVIFFISILLFKIPRRPVKEFSLFDVSLFLFLIEMMVDGVIREDFLFFFLVTVLSIIILNLKSIWDSTEIEDDKSIMGQVYPRIYKNNPIPIIVNGVLEEKNLKILKKDEHWVQEVLTKENIDLHKVYYAFYFNRNMHIIVY